GKRDGKQIQVLIVSQDLLHIKDPHRIQIAEQLHRRRIRHKEPEEERCRGHSCEEKPCRFPAAEFYTEELTYRCTQKRRQNFSRQIKEQIGSHRAGKCHIPKRRDPLYICPQIFCSCKDRRLEQVSS